MRTVIAALSGAAVATVLVLACSDDSPPVADAAGQCDCPAAEPPLSGRLQLVKPPPPLNEIQSGQSGLAAAECPPGGVIVSGGCFIDSDAPFGGIELRQAGPKRRPSFPEAWYCEFRNDTGGTQMVHAEALCLMPAQ